MHSSIHERFVKDTANHSVNIIRDDGLYRHLRCSNNGSFNYRFDIITWPGFLAYTGDMGCFVFSRIRDMFEFFGTGKINPCYWSEKLHGVDRINGTKIFSVGRFQKNVVSCMRNYLGIEDDETFPEHIIEVLEPILSAENEFDCTFAIRDCDHEAFNDFFEYDNLEYTHHYIWCCFAIVWAISKYSEIKSTACTAQ